MPYNQLNESERYVICHMHRAGRSNAQIARQLGRHPGTIGRELARNRDAFDSYFYIAAQQIHDQRRNQANRRYKLDRGPLAHAVRQQLKQRWAPEQIAGRLQRDHRDDTTMRVSHEAIYQWIYRCSRQGERWHEQLRRRRPRRKHRGVGRRTRGQIPGRVGIEQRPKMVDDRKRFGDWESDTMEGVKGAGLLVTHVERKSRYLRLGKLGNKRAAALSRVSNEVLSDLPRCLRRTMTVDNGKEFAAFVEMERALGLKVYFANPHSPWERGANENTNGLIRDFFPKGSDLRRVRPDQVAKAQRMLNNRPRKCLNYRTPIEVLNKLPGVALRN